MKLENHLYLEFVIKALKWVNMWPEKEKKWNPVARHFVLIITALSMLAVLGDTITLFYEGQFSFISISEDIVAFSALLGVIYIYLCFIKKRDEIQVLVKDLALFEYFTPASIILKTEKYTKFYTKFFIYYGIIGNLCYGLTPFLSYKNCQKNRSDHMLSYGIPCGLVVRYVLPFKFDYSPLKELFALEQIIACTLGTAVIMMVSMLICGLLIHITTHLKHLHFLMDNLSALNNHRLEHELKICLKFHITIVEYAKRIDDSFSQMMLLHITWTGFIISILGFQIIILQNLIDVLRFSLHLAGWLFILYLVCYYGQTLMDKSINISNAVYSVKWYEKPPTIRRYFILFLLRSQKPLMLKAFGLKTMSLETFIGVLYSAYSYFTLLLKMKS